MEVISSYNLFVDSDNSLQGKGDEFIVQVGNAGVNCLDGQFIRMSLESFSMYKNFYNVNVNNGQFSVRTSSSAVSTTALDFKNYKTIGDIADNFSEKLDTELSAATAISITETFLPAITEEMDSTSDRIISATLTFASAHPFTTGNKVGGGTPSVAGDLIVYPMVQLYEAASDSYALLGGDRIQGTALDTTTNSMITTWLSATVIKITAKYPAQRSTEEHIYLRCDLPNNNLETASMTASKADHTTHILSSDILGKMVIDHEFINYTSSTGKEFFLNIPNRSINTMRFTLRDSKDRPLGRTSGGGTAAGSGLAQSTLGNLNCSFVIKIEIVQAYNPRKLMSEPTPTPLNAKKIGVLQNMNFGVGNY
jgi:hypothetical protein